MESRGCIEPKMRNFVSALRRLVREQHQHKKHLHNYF